MKTDAVSPFLLIALLIFGSIGCDSSGEEGGEPFDNLLDIGVCAPDAGPFTLEIDNPYFPLPVGLQIVMEGVEDGETIRYRMTVLDETETVAGVVTRVWEEYETENGELTEISRNFFAQTANGTVCYFGEDVDIYEDGSVVAHDGAWRAGGDNQPGIFMLPDPSVDDAYQQEVAPGIAEDQARVLAVNETATTPAGVYSNTIRILDRNLLDGDEGEKVYAPGIGVIVDGAARAISVTLPSQE